MQEDAELTLQEEFLLTLGAFQRAAFNDKTLNTDKTRGRYVRAALALAHFIDDYHGQITFSERADSSNDDAAPTG